MVALAPKGAKPGAVMAETTEVTAKVLSVDNKTNQVTLEGVLGNQHTFTVAKNVDLSGVKVGDSVVVRYTQALAILVEKPAAN